MEYKITSGGLSAVISDIGGELVSVHFADGAEYMWQGDPATWPGRSFHIFPYVGRLTKGAYTLFGKEYRMDMHGLLLGRPIRFTKQAGDELSFTFQSTGQTYERYPYCFEYRQHYRLSSNSLHIAYEVANLDSRIMYFGLGCHPAFRVPLEDGPGFSDYFLEFSADCAPIEIGMTANCFVSGETRAYPLEAGKKLSLRYPLFDNDAVILENTGGQVRLGAKDGRRSVTLFYEGYRFLTIWTMPKANAPYLCIEPVTSLPSREGRTEDLAKQKDLVALAPGRERRFEMTLAFDK